MTSFPEKLNAAVANLLAVVRGKERNGREAMLKMANDQVDWLRGYVVDETATTVAIEDFRAKLLDAAGSGQMNSPALMQAKTALEAALIGAKPGTGAVAEGY